MSLIQAHHLFAKQTVQLPKALTEFNLINLQVVLSSTKDSNLDKAHLNIYSQNLIDSAFDNFSKTFSFKDEHDAFELLNHETQNLLLHKSDQNAKKQVKLYQEIAKHCKRFCKKQTIYWHSNELQSIAFIVQAIGEMAYSLFDRYSDLKKQSINHQALPTFTLVWHDANTLTQAQTQLNHALNLVQALYLAKDLTNLPANIATPTFLAEVATQIASTNSKFSLEVLDVEQIAALGMGSFLSVSRGSSQPPKFIVLKYLGDTAQQPTVLVGKGITFDTGGISLKPAPNMDEMKTDMAGAAAVLGTMYGIGLDNPAKHIIALIPTCENMPSSTAVKPGDVVKSKDGLTIEILNTDAEGRLILCDALTYAKEFKPKTIIDLATLTGACVVALGRVHAALYSYHDDLINTLKQAGESSLDTLWHMPLDDDYQEQLKSPFADLGNIGGPDGGSVTAACFLARFVGKDIPWAHLDIAGVARRPSQDKGATGRPVGLLLQYLRTHN